MDATSQQQLHYNSSPRSLRQEHASHSRPQPLHRLSWSGEGYCHWTLVILQKGYSFHVVFDILDVNQSGAISTSDVRSVLVETGRTDDLEVEVCLEKLRWSPLRTWRRRRRRTGHCHEKSFCSWCTVSLWLWCLVPQGSVRHYIFSMCVVLLQVYVKYIYIWNILFIRIDKPTIECDLSFSSIWAMSLWWLTA